jgi:hypothetical protein
MRGPNVTKSRFSGRVRSETLILACVGVVAVNGCLAADDGTLTRRDLSRESIRFLGFNDGRIHYFGADRNLTSIDSHTAVRIELERQPTVEDADTQWLLRLVDGQLLRGAMEGVSADGKLRWATRDLGVVEVSLDDVFAFDLARGEPQTSAQVGDSDLIVLANGDRLNGFIESINEQGLTLSRDEQEVELPWSSIGSVTLANPVSERSGTWLTLTWGSRIRVEGLHVAGGQVTGKALDRAVTVPLKAVRTFDFAEHHRIVPLGEMAHKVVAGGTVFGVEHPPAIAPEAIALHAPVTLRFELPPGATQFAAAASLDREGLDWADLVLIVSDGRGELFRQRLYGQAPDAAINVQLRDRTLTIQLDDGAQGPIRDRLYLTEPQVLIDTAAKPK